MNSSFSDQEAATASRVRVVVVNFNGGTLLADSLASLTRQTISDFEVIVVDNILRQELRSVGRATDL